jgi:hypothetical protein
MNWFLGWFGLGKSVKEESREQLAEIQKVNRVLETDKIGLERERRQLENQLKQAIASNDMKLAKNFARSLARVKYQYQRKCNKQHDMTVLAFEVKNMSSLSDENKILSGVAGLAKMYNKKLNITKVIKQHRNLNQQMNQIKEKQALVNESMDELVNEQEDEMTQDEVENDADLILQQMVDMQVLNGNATLVDVPRNKDPINKQACGCYNIDGQVLHCAKHDQNNESNNNNNNDDGKKVPVEDAPIFKNYKVSDKTKN